MLDDIWPPTANAVSKTRRSVMSCYLGLFRHDVIGKSPHKVNEILNTPLLILKAAEAIGAIDNQ
jgi:hypothetical protein